MDMSKDDQVELGLSQSAKDQLELAAYWARMIARAGYFLGGFLTLLQVLILVQFQRKIPVIRDATVESTTGLIPAIIMVVLVFYSSRKLHLFGSRANTALESNDPVTLEASLANLHAFFRLFGILLLTMFVLYIAVLAITGAAFFMQWGVH